MIIRLSSLFLVVAFVLTGPVAAVAQTVHHRSEYRISLLGLPLANAVFNTIVDGARYRIEGQLQSSGLAEVIERTRGTAIISGQLGGGVVQTGNYRISYNSGGKQKSTAIDFKGGNVVDTRNQPVVREREPWIPLQPGHLQNVVDPISALMVPVIGNDPAQVCNRTLRVYDGGMRADLALSAKGARSFKTQGFNGQAIICAIRFIPVGGYQQGKSSITFLAQSQDMEIWMAPAGNAGIFAPVMARIPTRIGRLTVRATRFEPLQ